MPVLVLMIMGAFWFGWAQHQISTMRYALQEASRALYLDPAMSEQQLRTMVVNELGSEGSGVTFSMTTATTSNGKEATLTATYVTSLEVPIAGTFPVSRSATVKTFLPAI